MSLSVVPSPLRERQRGLTRSLIVDAASRVVLGAGIHQFSMQQVADEAQVSLRTLYRYFSTREELLEGLGDEVSEVLRGAGLMPLPGSLTADSLSGLVGELFRLLAQHPDLARAWLIARTAMGTVSDSSRERSELLRRAVSRINPDLPAKEQERVYGIIKLLTGSISWKVLTDDVGLETDDAAEAVVWAARTVLADIESGGRPTGRP
ncbi:TetR/AcrR family transcriptional regulator [Agromyces sp. Soil535]|uniref:TetR/AcrR family transcriptional regulator n=1 Tax=Agromyces sp. Soil535 TaxID=1736390 RepID=UPI0009E846F6|nr:TetR/AcrR family transcriptional regulator [Agromyces sp. Soil535]